MTANLKPVGVWYRVRYWAVGIGAWWFVLGLLYLMVTGQLGR